MTALSIRQPWAWLIVERHKPIENRTWSTEQRGHILIHAGKAMTFEDYKLCAQFIARFTRIQLPPFGALHRGGIVGEADLIDCVSQSPSPWFVGPYGFVFAEAKPLPFFACRGSLGFFKIDYEPPP